MSNATKPKSSLHILLKALIPYTRENIQLSFHPHKFFNDLERQSGFKQESLKNTFRKAKKDGLIKTEDSLLEITASGLRELQPFEPKKLIGTARLMVIFDIPEENARMRRRFRLLLREWHFSQAQKSVWISDFDYKKELVRAIEELGLKKCVQVFECARLYPK